MQLLKNKLKDMETIFVREQSRVQNGIYSMINKCDFKNLNQLVRKDNMHRPNVCSCI